MSESVSHYFVDEAGDGNLFDRRGRSIIGTVGCSRYFILGFVDIADPLELDKSLQDLRHQLLNDPYFADVPSMQPNSTKTTLSFHAKDDLPEVRREVFALLRRWEGLRFYAVVRDKRSFLNFVRQQNEQDLSYRYHPNELYHAMVGKLFRQVIHRKSVYHICFASRGKATRTQALRIALYQARQQFLTERQITTKSQIYVTASAAVKSTCLQVTDYFLWALQRAYERGEDRYLRLLWHACRWVWDMDDTRYRASGIFYTQQKPLTGAALEERKV